MKKYLKNIIPILSIIIGTIIFFSFPVIMTRDSSGYASYLKIFNNPSLIKTWNPVRSFVFPLIIYLATFLGKNEFSLRIVGYIFYIITFYGIFKLLNIIFDSEKNKNFKYELITFIIILIFFNPMIFGYYHVLLTEYVAMTFSILSVYLAYLWLNTNKTKNYIITIIYFILLVLCWHLKQPYAVCAFIPFFLAMILSIIRNHKLYNILYRVLVLFVSLVILFLSIRIWAVVIDSDNKANSNGEFISGLTIRSNHNIREINRFDDKGAYKEIIVLNQKNKVVDKYKIYLNNNNRINIKDEIVFDAKYISKHPLLYLNNFKEGYFVASNNYHMTNVMIMKYDKKFTIGNCFENCDIGYRFYDDHVNHYFLSDEQFSHVKDFEKYNDSNKYLKCLFKFISPVSNYFYSACILLLPLIMLFIIIAKFMFNKSKLDNLINLNIILTGYSLLHIIIFILTGSILDRYQLPAFIVSILGYVCFGYLMYRIIKNKD